MYTDALPMGGSLPAPEDPALALMHGIASRDRRCMDLFYGLFQDKVYRLAAACLNDTGTAADLLNDVMLRVWEDSQGCHGETRVLVWLLRLTFHKSKVRVRDAQRDRGSDRLDDDAPDRSVLLERVQDMQRVQQAMARLPALHRVALHLAYFEDLPYAEIAAVIDCDDGTAKALVAQAWLALRQLLASSH